MMRILSAAFALFLCLPLLATTQEKAGEVGLEVVKYDALKDAIVKNRGKVVYVDFWFLNCPPCKAAFPHLVELYKKHHAEGLEVLTVNVNAQELPPEENFKGSLDFLKSAKASFRNVILDEDDKIWAGKLRIADFPSVYVFDRQGRWTQFSAPIKKDEVDQLVEKLLKEPAK